MLILTQNDEACVNVSNFESIEAYENGEILLTTYTGTEYRLGKYDSQERAKEVVGELFSLIGCSSRYNMPII